MRSKAAEDYRTYFDPTSIELVRRVYAEEIKLFGYSFDGTYYKETASAATP